MAEFDYFCHTCGRKIFTSDKPEALRTRAYCCSWCSQNATDSRHSLNQSRNDLWFWLVQTGRSAIYVAKLDDVAAALVYKSLRARKKQAVEGGAS